MDFQSALAASCFLAALEVKDPRSGAQLLIELDHRSGGVTVAHQAVAAAAQRTAHLYTTVRRVRLFSCTTWSRFRLIWHRLLKWSAAQAVDVVIEGNLTMLYPKI